MKKQLCTFTIDEMNLGVNVNQVQEILRRQEITEVPLAPRTIAGLLNLRGQIVMVTDLKKKALRLNVWKEFESSTVKKDRNSEVFKVAISSRLRFE